MSRHPFIHSTLNSSPPHSLLTFSKLSNSKLDFVNWVAFLKNHSLYIIAAVDFQNLSSTIFKLPAAMNSNSQFLHKILESLLLPYAI